MLEFDTTPVVVYHDNCHDGITALWVAKERWPNAKPVPGAHGVPPNLTTFVGQNVLFVDFTYPVAIMRELASVATRIVIVDHHATAEADLAQLSDVQNVTCHFDMARSGAGMTWDVLYPGQERPDLVNYVEDRDLWRFALDDSREIHLACDTMPLTLENRAILANTPIDVLRRRGHTIAAYQAKLLASALATARVARVAAWDVPTVAMACIELRSEVGNTLAKGQPFAVTYVDFQNYREVSLRSAPGGLDVGKLAALYGGGGHAHAAGFRCRVGEFPEALGGSLDIPAAQ